MTFKYLIKICRDSLTNSIYYQINFIIVQLSNDFENIKKEVLGSVNALRIADYIYSFNSNKN